MGPYNHGKMGTAVSKYTGTKGKRGKRGHISEGPNRPTQTGRRSGATSRATMHMMALGGGTGKYQGGGKGKGKGKGK